MIRKTQVFRKSAKGAEAIATRQHGLGPKQRSMLILVDGKRKVEELIRLAQALGDAEPTLQFLADQGFVEEMAGSEPAPPHLAPGVHAQPAPTQAKSVPLAEAQRFAVRQLTDILGPTAESLCLRIEAARNSQDFESAVTRAQNMVREIRGGSVADRFTAELQAHWPA